MSVTLTLEQQEENNRRFQELEASRKLLASVYQDPNLRGGIRDHIKKHFPDRHLIDDDVEAATGPIRKELEKLQKQNEELLANFKKRDENEDKSRKEQQDADYATRLHSARRQFNLTDEGFDQMVARMKETGNYTDPMAAAAYIVSQAPPALPPGSLYGTNISTFAGHGEPAADQDYKLLHSGLDGPARYLEKHIRDAFGPNGKAYVEREMGKTYADLAFAN